MGSAYYGGQLKATGHQSEIEIERTFAICFSLWSAYSGSGSVRYLNLWGPGVPHHTMAKHYFSTF